MKWVFVGLIIFGYFFCCWQQIHFDPSVIEIAPMQALSNALLKSADEAIMLAIHLVGVMALFLGLIKVAEDAGLIDKLAFLIAPLLRPLFPSIPQNHPALGAMVMNFSANILGAGNAATPFGIKTMQHLESLNKKPGVASDAMIMFLAINTSSLTLIPVKVIALRQAAGSINPSIIIPTTIFATFCSTLAAIFITWLIQRKNTNANKTYFSVSWKHALFYLLLLSLIPLMWLYGMTLSSWILPSFFVAIILMALFNRIDIYASFVEGAKQGFNTAIKIMPYLVAIFAAITIFRASGAFESLIKPLGYITEPLGLPVEALPMALLRPFSGSGSLAVLADTINQPSIGPDSPIGYMVSTMMGSTETTFYVLAVYFGAVQIKKIRYALVCALSADLVGIIMSVMAVKIML